MINEVRSQAGVPELAAFKAYRGTPIVIDSDTGYGYSLRGDDTVVAFGAGGTVTSIDVSAPNGILAVSGGPITTSGTIALAWSVTANRVLYATGSDTVGSSANLTFDGTTLVSTALQTPTINGGTAANDDITIQGTTNATRTTSYVNLQPNGGNVGIGTTTPPDKLVVQGISGNALVRVLSGSSAAGGYTGYGLGRTSTEAQWSIASQANDWISGTAAGDVVFGTIGATKLFLDTNSIARVTIGSTGNVGIGTTSTTNKLHVYGSTSGTLAVMNENTNTAGYAEITSQVGSGFGGLGFGGSTASGIWINRAYLYSLGSAGINIAAREASGDIRLYTGGEAAGNERVRIDSTGNVGIGTTSPIAVLHLKAGTATASTAPLKFTAGTNLTAAEAGAVEYDGTRYYVSVA